MRSAPHLEGFGAWNIRALVSLSSFCFCREVHPRYPLPPNGVCQIGSIPLYEERERGSGSYLFTGGSRQEDVGTDSSSFSDAGPRYPVCLRNRAFPRSARFLPYHEASQAHGGTRNQRASLSGSLSAGRSRSTSADAPEKVSSLVLVSSGRRDTENRDSSVVVNEKKQADASTKRDMNAYIEYFQRSWTDGRAGRTGNRDVARKA